MPYELRRKPERIICLTEEPTEILYLLGEEQRIVGITAYTVRPPEAKRDKPVVTAFISGSVKKMVALEADLIIGFSDIQAQLAADLIKANQQVLIFNQRSVQEILDNILILGNLVGRLDRAERLVEGYIKRLAAAEERTLRQSRRPTVYFEEWDDPQITGIEWVSELIGLAGGDDIFAARSKAKNAQDRFVSMDEVATAAPECVLACWCGKPFDREAFVRRDRAAELPAVRNGHIHELDPAAILQPGPGCLTDGLDSLEAAIRPLTRP